MPLLANGKGVGKGMDGRQRTLVVDAHDFPGVGRCGVLVRIIEDEAAVLSHPLIALELNENVGGFVGGAAEQLTGRTGGLRVAFRLNLLTPLCAYRARIFCVPPSM